MSLATQKRHNSHAKHSKAIYKKSAKGQSSLLPLKRMNKNLTQYVIKKPYKSLGIATLVTGIVVGFLYARIKYFK